MAARQRLTFETLDDVAFAAERGRLSRLPPEFRLTVDTLGPLMEFRQLSAAETLPPLQKTPWIDVDGAADFIEALTSGKRQWVCPKTRRSGFFHTASQWPSDETPWIGFGLAAQQAAIAAGFKKRTAHQLVGALDELHSNIYEHSGHAVTGLIAFRAASRLFEFAVTDRGVGILSSLTQCVDYVSVSDHGEALRLALTDGVSRHGTTSGHGHGFRALFVGLANLSGLLRFRSGDHAIIIDGRQPTLMTAKTAQKAPLPGFVATIASRSD